MSKSYLEFLFSKQLSDAGLDFGKELNFAKPDFKRAFRADFYLAKYNLLIEIEGGEFKDKSRHRTPSGFIRDCEKYNLINLLGYRMLRLTGKQVQTGYGIDLVKAVIAFLESNNKKNGLKFLLPFFSKGGEKRYIERKKK